uniref:Calcium binding protein 5b n=1 Tax=Astyanax mexicanus TaxID=7994 RepID=A0A8B9JNM9_ASTMX
MGFVLQARQLVADEIEELRDAFREFDKDKDGLISCKDLGNLMRTMGYMPTEMELIELGQNINMNRKKLYYFRCSNTFVHVMQEQFISLQPNYHCFIPFDMDGDGNITIDELRHAMQKLLGESTNRKEIEAVVKEADNNGDGTVDFEGEFVPIS